jgi:hypothetical protein
MIGQSKLTPYQQFLVDALVSRIKSIRATNTNINIMSTNNSQKDIRGFTEDLAKIFGKHLPENYRTDIISYRIYLRQIADIAANNYAGRQRFHVNESRSPIKGKAFLQFIYFVETPKREGRNAPIEDRGTLLLVSPSGKVREIVPEQGKFIFFSPDDTYHEVAKQENPDLGSVSRNMIIGMLYRRSPNNQVIDRQIRMSSPRARTTRAIVGRAPLNSTPGPALNANAITTLVKRLQIKPVKSKSTTPKRTPIKSKKSAKIQKPKINRIRTLQKSRGIEPK